MNQKTRGPKPETVKLKDDWRGAIKKALQKKRPAEGWPEKKGLRSPKKS
jgi:hypothetical protein